MARTHPPTLLTLARRTLGEECGCGRGDTILVAVSGGPDSQALLHALGLLAKKLGIVVAAHGVDHGLRAEAAAELGLAAELAQRLRVPFASTRVSLADGGNLQARARAARRDALEQAARAAGARFIATGHHADDRAETVLLRLLRGAGPRGLAVLPPRDGKLIRPMVRARRADVLAHLERHAVPFASDPSNADRRFLRSRVRHELLPLLEELSPGVVTHLTALADALSEAPAPTVQDRDGRQIRLGRAQLSGLRRAIASGSTGARIRLSQGLDLSLDRASGSLVVSPRPLARRRARGGD